MRPTQGVTFGGRYELDSRIAIGGMGEVWEANDHVIGRTVAIKILKDEYMGDPGFLERFRAEARHAALVNHEGIASVFDYGEENGSAFLVMELVPGEALSTVLERDGSLSSDKTLDIVAQTAAALQAAHAAGLVHRDIKPGNLLITPDGRVKITDFGIARIADQVPLTATGQVMGTVQYLSPEQASGHPASPSTDIYSLGIVAYECLAGKRPFTGESQVAIAMAQINEQAPPLPPTIAAPVRNLVMAMITKKPEERPSTAAAVSRAAAALRRGDVAAAASAVPAVADGVLETDAATQLLTAAGATGAATQLMPSADADAATGEPVKKKKRSPWTWPLVALVALLLIVLGGTVFAIFGGQGGDADPTASASTSKPAPSKTTPSSTPSESTVSVNALGLEGLTCDDASARLDEAGLAADCTTGNSAPNAESVGVVYEVNPTGNVPEGTIIKLTVYAGEVELEAPSAPSMPDTAVTGTSVQVTWAGYTCPSGTGAVSSYEFTATNGVFPTTGQSTASFGSGERSADLQITGTEGQTVIVNYTVTCSGGSSTEARTSPTSGEATLQVQAPEPAPDPSSSPSASTP
ncbi:serine/threonine-protein kinase [Microbacterium endophyticum]|uniref:non-specific serine/threonine protein kinase n=1 Tax=Microbacterium endophyticum TaxID=1526412 RepID=A0A7W4V467_9MICO|nr:serine/threonine-protein kinase [Microbacterium endophyticum]MBB2976546.1 serine/threonine-protein kinase [Microbacterium endophyticum]NIK35992.1 serine/threonine-protein kinase [Microbacterium endophyticum]